MQPPLPSGHKRPFGCNGYVTAVAVGQRQRLYSGVRMFTGFYLSSINISGCYYGVDLESNPLTCTSCNTPVPVCWALRPLYSTPHISGVNSSWPFGVFRTYFYNHAHRTRLEKLFQLELFRSFNGHFKATSGSRWRFHFRNRHTAVSVSEVKRSKI